MRIWPFRWYNESGSSSERSLGYPTIGSRESLLGVGCWWPVAGKLLPQPASRGGPAIASIGAINRLMPAIVPWLSVRQIPGELTVGSGRMWRIPSECGGVVAVRLVYLAGMMSRCWVRESR